MARLLRVFLALLLACTLAACGGDTKEGAAPAPKTVSDAKAMLGAFMGEGADPAALTMKMRPTSADYADVFEDAAAAKAKAIYDGSKGPWAAGVMKITRKPAQTEMLVWSATTEELRAWSGDAKEFPGGYKDIANLLKPGVTWFRFKFVEPGKKLGMAYDGLVHVNEHWALFPKPYRALK